MEIIKMKTEPLDSKGFSGSFSEFLDRGYNRSIPVKFYPAEHRVSIISTEGMKNTKNGKIARNYKVSTRFPSLVREYLRMPSERIFPSEDPLSDVRKGISEFCIDYIPESLDELVEVRPILHEGDVVAVREEDHADLPGRIVAFEGIDGAGKTAIAKYLTITGLGEKLPVLLMTPYSSGVGKEAQEFRKQRMVKEWATLTGNNRWVLPKGINIIYDRNILTWMTEAFRYGLSEHTIYQILDSWKPLPDQIFLLDVDPEIAFNRSSGMDEFSTLDYIREDCRYFYRAALFAQDELGIRIRKIDTSRRFGDTIDEITSIL